MINELIPAKFRKPVYYGYALIGVVIGAIEVAYLETGVDAPTWVGVAMTVYLFVGGAVGLTAGVHTRTGDPAIVGNTTGSHLHVEVANGDIDPEVQQRLDSEVKRRRDLRGE